MTQPRPAAITPPAGDAPRGESRSRLLGALVAATFGSSADEFEEHLDSGLLKRATQALAELAERAAPELPGSLEVSDLEAARVSLFRANPGGLPAPPYAGLAIDDQILGPAVERLEALLAEHGYRVADDWTDLPDHLAVLGAVLADEGCPALLAGRLEREYLQPWLKRYAGSVSANDSSGVYAAVTSFLAACTIAEAEVGHAAQA